MTIFKDNILANKVTDTEIVSQRTPVCQVFKTSDGQLKKRFYTSPIFYKEGNSYLPIVLESESSLSSKGYTEDLFLKNNTTFGFRKDLASYKFIGVRNGVDKQVEISLHSMTVDGQEINVNAFQEIKKLSETEYEHVINNEISVCTKIKKSGVVTAYKLKNTIKSFEVVEEFHLTNVAIESNSNIIKFNDGSVIPEPIMWNEDKSACSNGVEHLMYIEKERIFYKKILKEVKFLENCKDFVYIDASYYTSASDGWKYKFASTWANTWNNTTSTTYPTDDSIDINVYCPVSTYGYISRGFLFINTSSLTSAQLALATSIKLFVNVQAFTASDNTMELTLQLGPNVNDPLVTNDDWNPTTDYGTKVGQITVTSTGLKSFTLTSSSVVAEGTSKFVIREGVYDYPNTTVVGTGKSKYLEITSNEGGTPAYLEILIPIAKINNITKLSINRINNINFNQIDSYTKLLIKFNGADGATTYTAETGQTVTFVGTAQLDTAQYKFGGSSLLLDGNSDYLTAPSSVDFNFADGNWTVDYFVRFASLPTNGVYQTQVAHYNASTSQKSWSLRLGRGSGVLGWYFIGSSDGVTTTWNPKFTDAVVDVNTWYHVAWVRSGTTLYCFRDGVSKGTLNMSTTALYNSTALFTIGAIDGPDLYTNGWIDEVRVSKGIARWTTDFTPPTRSYSNDVAKINNISI